MWVKLENVVVANAFWITERANPYFVLQRRLGHGTKGFSSLLVGTIDSVFDTKPLPFRILHQISNSDTTYIIAASSSFAEILKDWEYIENHLMPTLTNFENDADVTDFIKYVISSVSKFIKLFSMPEEEKLVNYYYCSYFKGSFPRQGWLCISINHLCFYSNIFGNEIKIITKWIDVKDFFLHQKHHLEIDDPRFFPNSIRVITRTKKYLFSMFLRAVEVYSLMEQLANLAMKSLISDEKQHLLTIDNEQNNKPKYSCGASKKIEIT
ncbi:TBC1 domain member 8B, variant 4 [Dermatophagoides farinae]|uniref:TBC1 domain member 8B, variant 4 n=1 Tax=Dermatophagoides farinae TaxID=6954 RepID=A0A922L133_DERFA|nr:TBC1 domain member 8B, variant 4 [Dermatophagoides farinae]